MSRTRRPPQVLQEQLIAALLPDVHAAPPPHAPAPMPTLPAPALPAPGDNGLLVGMARIDRSGRLSERRLLEALGWTAGQRLATDLVHGLIVVRAASGGPQVIDHRGTIHLPAAMRHMCDITVGPPVVLAASVAGQRLVIHPAAVVARLLASHYADLMGCLHEP